MYRISGIIVDNGDYPNLPSYVFYFIQTFRNAIGDEATPVTTFWKIKEVEGPKISVAMIYYGWGLWIMSVLINLVILLNFLIAIISQAYENVMARENEVIYAGKCDTIFEVTLLVHFWDVFRGKIKDA